MFKIILITLVSVSLVLGQQHQHSTKKFVEGKASFYGKEFEGRKTANGEIFSNYKFTAAHRKHKFGTYMRVVNLKNNLSVTVRVNDRGPYNYTRIIDLSETAARRIGSYMHGLTTVRIEQVNVLERNKEIDSIFTCTDVSDCLGNEEKLNGFSISLYSTSDLVHIIYLANELYLQEDVDKVLIVGNGIAKSRTYQIVVSNYSTKKEALLAKDFFERKGFMKVMLMKS